MTEIQAEAPVAKTGVDEETREFEARKLYHSAAMDEFKALKSDMMATTTEQHKVLSLVVASLPVAALASAYVSKGTFVVPSAALSLASVGYSILLLYMLHNYHSMIGMARYQKSSLLPRIEENLRLIGGEPFKEIAQPIRWEHEASGYLDEPLLANVSPFLVAAFPSVLLACWSGLQLWQYRSVQSGGAVVGKGLLLAAAWGALLFAGYTGARLAGRVREHQGAASVAG